mgnify:FL=1
MPSQPHKASRLKRVTLADIAARLGVTKVTVSRALNQPEKVSAAMRERVTECARELGYMPNRQAGSLASGHSRLIALLIPSLSNAVFSELHRGLEAPLAAAGYQLLIGHTGYSMKEEERLIETWLSFGIDGLVLCGSRHSPRTREMIARSGCAVVECMEKRETPLDMAVGLDQHAAGRAMTEAMIALGHRHIGFLGARMDRRVEQRLGGWRAAMEAAGLSQQALLTTDAPSSVRMGGELLDEMLTRWPETQAVFCCNDDLAAGGLFECQRRGLSVPDQLALAGFNGLEMTRGTWPPLASVVTPRREIGERAATLLLARLNGDLDATPHGLWEDLGFSLQTGGSLAP